MDVTNKLLNLVLPPLAVILLVLLFPVYLILMLFIYVKGFIDIEDVKGKVVLITGASSGIGEETAYEYARRGARLVVVARREDRLKAVASKALELGSPEVIHVCADVSKAEDSKRFIDEAINRFGQLDHLVNNAGVPSVGFFERTSMSDLTRIMGINFWGSVYSTHFALPYLRTTKGKIIVVSSAIGRFPMPNATIYNASKAAIISLYETLRVEVGSEIGVTIVTPGYVTSEMTTGKHRIRSSFMKSIPMESASEFAKAMVESVCRGERCLTEPSWVRVVFLFKTFYPEVVDWLLQKLVIFKNNSTKTA